MPCSCGHEASWQGYVTRARLDVPVLNLRVHFRMQAGVDGAGVADALDAFSHFDGDAGGEVVYGELRLGTRQALSAYPSLIRA